MNKRQCDLLKKLIIQKKYMPMKYFSDILNISRKTVSNDIDEIEKIINPIGAKIDRKQGIGIRIYYTPSQLDELNNVLNNIKVSNKDNDLEYRRIQILLNLLIPTSEYTTIQKLSDEHMVSRTSINNDLDEIQKILDIYNLSLSKTLKGTRIVGSEINIRKALVSIVQEYGKTNPDYIVEYQNIRHKELNIDEINTILNKEYVFFFEELLNELENKLKLVIYEPYYTNLLTHLVIMTNRIINGNYIDDILDLNESVLVVDEELYSSAVYLIKEIEKKFNIEIDKQEIVYIYKHLISIGLSHDNKDDNNEKNIKEFDLPPAHFTEYLIDIVSQMSNTNYRLRPNLYDRLLLHIKPMLNRIKYNIQIKNPLLNDFLREFEEEFFIMKIACFLACNKFGINKINDHEVSYILSYFISENEKIVEAMKIKILVICHSGYGTSQLLAARLEKAFNNIEVVNIVASKSVDSIDLDKIDLIVSTVNLDIEQPYLIVSAFLNEIDKENIRNYIEMILENKRKLSSNNPVKTISLETINGWEDMEGFKGYFIEDKLIHIKNNTYVYLVYSGQDSVKKYVYEQDNSWKHIFAIRYSNYIYLSEVLRQIVRGCL